jgi:protein involved in polysaccharide export with SLBB domain
MRKRIIWVFLLFPTILWSERISVYIWGEVKLPGKYYVPSGTSIIDVISTAGGPTNFADLKKVKIVHTRRDTERVEIINLEEYLKKKSKTKILEVYDSDVILVPTNSWYTWKQVIKVLGDVALVVNVGYLIIRELRTKLSP